MNRDELQRLRAIVISIEAWSEHAREVSRFRVETKRQADLAVAQLRSRVIELGNDRKTMWRAIPLRSGDEELLRATAQMAQLEDLSEIQATILQRLEEEVPAQIETARVILGVRRSVTFGRRRKDAQRALSYLQSFHDWALAAGLSSILNALDQRERVVPAPKLIDALADDVGLHGFIAQVNKTSLVRGNTLAALPAASEAVEKALKLLEETPGAAKNAGEAVRTAETDKAVRAMPVERLRDATHERIRVQPLRDAGIRNVQEVLDREYVIAGFRGIGYQSARAIVGAAREIRNSVYAEMPVRIDLKSQADEATMLLALLTGWRALRQTRVGADDSALVAELQPLIDEIDSSFAQLILFEVEASQVDFRYAVNTLLSRSELFNDAMRLPADPWGDFRAAAADYYVMLQELGLLVEDEQSSTGGLPSDVVERVRAFELDTTHLSVSLRGYQAFGARFSLVQKKVIIGDEMGLGKTIEALTVLAHLHGKGKRHSIVICPAAVLTNWMREVSSKSELHPRRLYGVGREDALRDWVRIGGVGVTTFGSLGWLEDALPDPVDVACVVVDEAHYIKNPQALRSIRTSEVIERAEHALLLTGTPLENRVEEFKALVSYVNPKLVVDATDLRPKLFRKQVATAYLRRNQEDVLTELPELIETDEWISMSPSDRAKYRSAVLEGNFAALRQAAMVATQGSAKLERLLEIVEEAQANGRRVLVFSQFLNVLDTVVHALGDRAVGPLKGSVPALKRQQMVDDFSTSGFGSVLVAQITAGGIGLNIQAASVVIICEPQLKPTSEWQAIARSRRMGQLETVQVHRLLSDEGVDVRITELLARKREIFAEFAARSELAEQAPEAFDISEAELVKEVLQAERRRLLEGLPLLENDSEDESRAG